MEPAAVAAALAIVGLTLIWFILERNFESLIAMIASFSALFSIVSLKRRRINWLLAGLVLLVALGGLYLVQRKPSRPPSAQVVITQVSFEGIGQKEPDEFVEIRNRENYPINLRGWTLSDQSNNEFIFPDFSMDPGSFCRIYTDEDHPEWCGFNFNSSQAVWDNGGDCATLRDLDNRLVDEFCYP